MYLKRPLGCIQIDELRRADVLKALRSMQFRGLSRSSIEQARNVISGVCEYGIDYEYLAFNPCAGIMKRLGLKRTYNRNAATIFSQNEITLILDTCLNYRPGHYPIFLTAFRTGMRLGELLALKWENINWRKKFVVVKESFRNGKLTGTKNGKIRRVDMSDQLFDVLKALHMQRKREALKAGSHEIVPIIFHTNGEYTSQNTIRNIWKRILDKSKLDYRKFHAIRHTFASLLISGGQSLAYVKEMMGHGSIQITVDVYGHLIPSENRSAVNTLDDAPTRTLSAPTQKEKP